ncbi:glutamate--tRNA ligase [Candidatus Saccharibacteria bacterium]|nr:glutamate--tRNA ligase [Candidatus Saccharibacteria bacterium]
MIRTRFAPSPTGYAHVGNIRTALFAYLVARHAGGKFILRLEDTDKNREVDGADDYILNAVKVLGMPYDEGPDIGGPHAPYRQSQRLETYRVWADKLIASGRAYADPLTAEEIQKFRDEANAAKKPFLYRNHRPTTFDAPADWYGQAALRFRSDPQAYQWHDEVMGDLSAGPEVIDDFVLIKSDGYPTYNFAHVVDDAEMECTHIIRGQEFLPSVPNYLNLYAALDLTPPIMATVPHILNEAGNKKLGKRDGAKDALEYLRDGYLLEALINFIASLGWNDGTEQEIFSLDELIAKFSLERVQKSGARFDEKRLAWMNGQWIKRLDLGELHARTVGCSEGKVVSGQPPNFWGPAGQGASAERQREVLSVVVDRLKTLADLPALSEYFFARPEPNWTMVDENKQLQKIPGPDRLLLLQTAATELAKIESVDWQAENLQNKLNELLEQTNSKPPILFGLIRFALTWAPFSPGLPETCVLLGRDETLARLDIASNQIGK